MKELKELKEKIQKEQDWQQKRTDELWVKFKELDKKDADYNKMASEYYYNNGMNNQLILVIHMIESEMNK